MTAATDLFGPSLSTGGVTTRPGETRSFSGADTWLKDCEDPNVDDGSGTNLSAAFFNQFLAAMRGLTRGNGNRQDGTGPIIDEANSDDALLLKSVQTLIQRGLSNYAADAGSADALVVSLAPALAEYKSGSAPIRIRKSNAPNATITPTINVNGLGPVVIVSADGSALEIGELQANARFSVAYDGTNFRLISPPQSATAGEVEAGALYHKFISPATQQLSRVQHFVINQIGGSTSLPTGVVTKITHLLGDGGHFLRDGASSIASSQFVCGPKDAGMWLIQGYAGLAMNNPANYCHWAIRVNGTYIDGVSVSTSTVNTMALETCRMFRLQAGDVVDIACSQTSGVTQSALAGQLWGIRLGA